jgi:hypothetical protein
MTLPRVIICLILFPIIMYGFSSLLHLASDNYGYFGLVLTIIALLTSVVLIGKSLGVDFS